MEPGMEAGLYRHRGERQGVDVLAQREMEKRRSPLG